MAFDVGLAYHDEVSRLWLALFLGAALDAGASPGARFGHEMVYDEGRAETLLFGGFGPDGIPLGDTWAWDGEAWRVAATTGPSPRKWAAAAYDVARNVVVLFGGREGVARTGASLADTWIWNGASWRQVETMGPSGRDHHRMVYDRRRERVVLFGGWDGEKLVGDTWEWDGETWTEIDADGPSPRAPVGFAYLDELELAVLTGGQDLERAFSDAWTWDGSSWKPLDVSLPERRGFHGSVYDPDGLRLLVLGGRDGERLYRDLLSWDGAEWKRLSSDGPDVRGIYAAVYDRRRREVVVHGGGTLTDGVWTLQAKTRTWTEERGWRAVP